MAFEHRIVRRVEFSETDMAGIVHFSNFFRYMEAAEHDFFRLLGHSVTLNEIDPTIGLPRVHAHCDYLRPLRFEDEFEIRILIEKISSKSLTYRFRMRRGADGQGETVARGAITVVCVHKDFDGVMKAVRLPEVLSRKLEEAPKEVLEEGD